jgi:quercetin dioxygenase-like cupin family protein
MKLADHDAFERELAETAGTDAPARGLERSLESLQPIAPSAPLRARLMASAKPETRLLRFAAAVAGLLEVSVERASELLARVDDRSAFSVELPGVSLLWVDGGPSLANAVRGFVRVEAGCEFPEHEHLGEETVLVLQGRYVDSGTGEVFGPGDLARMPAGSSHGFRVPKGGPDLLKLAVVQVGLRAGEKVYEPRSGS